MRPAGPPLEKSLSIGPLVGHPDGDSPAAGRVLSVVTVGQLQDASAPCMASCIHLGETLPPSPQKTLSDVECVVFSVAVNVLCHVAVCVPPPLLSYGLGTGNGGFQHNKLQDFQTAQSNLCRNC